MKLLLTGGHLAPALALIETIKENYPQVDIVFVGRKFALDSEKTLSLEYKEITKHNIRFLPLTTGRLNRSLKTLSLKSLLKTSVGLINAIRIIKDEKPDVILTFGGYIALPVAIAGKFFRIPIYTHEQTISPGLANKIIAYLSKKIFLSFAETSRYFPEKKSIVTGNPVRSTILKINKKPFKFPEDKPLIYVTGGSLGSHSINLIIEKVLPKLLKKYSIIHQTGDTKEYQDYEKLSKMKTDHYIPVKHLLDDEIGFVFNKADIVISRAGANTFFELLTLKKPTIFIPLPWSANHEQEKQAELFKQAGVGEIFDQSDDPEKLPDTIDSILARKNRIRDNFRILQHLYKKDAAQFILKQILAAD